MNNRFFLFSASLDKFRFVLISCLLLYISIDLHSQFTSLNNYSGSWTDSSSWIDNNVPENSVVDADLNIYGEITSNACLDFNLCTLIIHDTLIIHGNLELKNTCNMSIDSSALLIVLGDYYSKNKVEVLNNGTMIVAGRFEMLGADNQGSFLNNGNLYLFDTVPAIKEGEAYTSISCTTNRDGSVSCGYMTQSDLIESNYFPYYSSLPFNLEAISIDGNSCYVLEINLAKTDYCVDETFMISSNSIGISDTGSLIWDFGEDAIPATGTGTGPHSVKYSSYGNKVIALTYSEDLEATQSLSVDVHEAPANDLYFIRLDEGSNLESNLDSICQGDSISIRIDGGFDDLFHWYIPVLEIDTISDDILETIWDVPNGEYIVSINEISSYTCVGLSYQSYVVVDECIEKDPEVSDVEEIYAFTPNGDRINDYWIIENIENYPLAKIKVFDRNGRIVFSSDGYYQNNWDGTKNGEVLELNSYFFIIDFSAYNKPDVRGVVTILHE